jgi:hypothetical protein
VHRLDRISVKKPAKLLDSKSLTLRLFAHADLAGFFTLHADLAGRFRAGSRLPESWNDVVTSLSLASHWVEYPAVHAYASDCYCTANVLRSWLLQQIL